MVGVGRGHGLRVVRGWRQWQLLLLHFLRRRGGRGGGGGGGEVGLDVGDVGGVGEREALVDGVGEGGGEEGDGAGGDEGPHDAAADDLALAGGEQHGEAGRAGRRGGGARCPLRRGARTFRERAAAPRTATSATAPDAPIRHTRARAAARLRDARRHVGPGATSMMWEWSASGCPA